MRCRCASGSSNSSLTCTTSFDILIAAALPAMLERRTVCATTYYRLPRPALPIVQCRTAIRSAWIYRPPRPTAGRMYHYPLRVSIGPANLAAAPRVMRSG